MTHIKINKALLASDINGYSSAGQEAKNAFHKEGKAFLKKLDAVVNPNKEKMSIRSNLAGIAVSGEVTCHSADMYIQLYESCTNRGVQMMYRSCKSEKDYTGNTNNFVSMKDFVSEDGQARLIQDITRLIEIEKERKAQAPAPVRPKSSSPSL